MDTAVRYIELMKAFTDILQKQFTNVATYPGRKFDRVAINDAITYFVDKDSWKIYGAKSAAQYNPRREYGGLDTADQFDWATGVAKANTALAEYLEEREAVIAAGYKKRGRPRKTPAGTP